MKNIKFFILGGHSIIYTLFSLGILLRQEESINFAFGRLGTEKGRIDNSVAKILSKSYALAILSFTIPGLYFAYKKKKEAKVMFYPLILYHFFPIYLTFKNHEFRSGLPSLYIWHSFLLISIVTTLVLDKIF